MLSFITLVTRRNYKKIYMKAYNSYPFLFPSHTSCFSFTVSHVPIIFLCFFSFHISTVTGAFDSPRLHRTRAEQSVGTCVRGLMSPAGLPSSLTSLPTGGVTQQGTTRRMKIGTCTNISGESREKGVLLLPSRGLSPPPLKKCLDESQQNIFKV